MTGLVNAAGTPEFVRVQQGHLRKKSDEDRKETYIPIFTKLQAAARALDTAVEVISQIGNEAQRGLPSGDESDRNDQADLESGTPAELGGLLDVEA